MYAAAEMRGREMVEREKKVQRRGGKMVPFWRRILNLCEKGEEKQYTLSEKFGPPGGCPIFVSRNFKLSELHQNDGC